MAMSPHLAAVRAKLGHDLIAVTAASISVFDNRARILLVKLADTGTWALPGGAIDPNELPADAAVRECWEETGLLVQPFRLIGVFGGPDFLVHYPNGDVTYYTTIALEARRLSGTCKADGSETLDVGYFSQTDCGRITITASSRIIVEQAFASRGAVYFAPATWSPKFLPE